jgi:hypothetical protein
LNADVVAKLVASAATGGPQRRVLLEAGLEIARLSAQTTQLGREAAEATETATKLAADNARLRSMLTAISAQLV